MKRLLEKLKRSNTDFFASSLDNNVFLKLYDKGGSNDDALHEEITLKKDKTLIVSLHIGKNYHKLVSSNFYNLDNFNNENIIERICSDKLTGHIPTQPKNSLEYCYDYKYQIGNYDDNDSDKRSAACALILYFHITIGKPILDSLFYAKESEKGLDELYRTKRE